ncbi:MAG: 30S ribosomal protein S20 [Nitrospiraceae bacterium]
MPVIHKSTIRRARLSERHRLLKRATLSAVKGVVKKVLTALETKQVDDAKATLREATSALRKAVTKGVLKPNTASRRIARLAARVNSLTTSQA